MTTNTAFLALLGLIALTLALSALGVRLPPLGPLLRLLEAHSRTAAVLLALGLFFGFLMALAQRP